MHREFEIFRDEFERFFQPVIAGAADSSSAKSLLYNLGYVPPSQFRVLQNLRANIDAVRSVIENMSELSDEQIENSPELIITNAKNAVEALQGLFNNLKNISALLETELVGSELLEQTDILESLPRKLFDFLTIEYLREYFYKTYSALNLLGVIEINAINTVSNPFESPRLQQVFHWNRIGDLISSPLMLLKNTIKDNNQYFYKKSLRLIQEWGLSLGLFPHYRSPNTEILKFISNDPLIEEWHQFDTFEILRFPLLPNNLDTLCIDVYPIINRTEDKIKGLVLVLGFDPAVKEFNISDQFKLTLKLSGSVANGLGIIIDENDEFRFVTDLFGSPQDALNNVQFDFKARVTKKDTTVEGENDKFLQLGTANGNRLEIGSFNLTFGVEKKENTKLYVETEFLQGLIALKFDEADGFISNVLGKGIETNFSAGFGLSNSNGFYFTNSSGLEIDIPTHVQLGPLEIKNVQISIKSDERNIVCHFASSVLVSLGPLKILVNNIGISFPGKTDGNFTFIPIGFKPPTGIGLTVDAGGIKGGGILDFNPAKEEYFGALELEFKDLLSLKAFGIINTRLPDGTKGFSLLIIVTAEFNPVQLGLGFTLNGVGGLLGAHRTTKVEVLKEGVKTNTLKSILFPEDVVANIDRIVSDIKQVFPPLADHFLICPMGKIGWGSPTIITMELAILIEIPASDFKILGVLKALLPEEKNPLLRLQVNFLGIIDFENRLISFDASLYDSKILTFTLTGDMALRLGFGDKPVFLLSVGGFHPAFKDVPADLKTMRRLTISLYDGKDARIIIQTYLAVTSNTAQFGARAELFAQKGSFNIYGFIGHDVLFQFTPFKFIAAFGAGVALRRHSSVIMSIRVSGQLSGPKPWDARGEASVSFFFFSVSVPFHVTWGDSREDPDKQIEDLLALLQAAINDNRNWLASIPTNNKLHVSIRSIAESEMAVHPFGILTFSERLVPLEVEINKYGNKLPKDVRRFEIKVDDTNLKTDEAREQFAAANFFDMKDDEKLSRPSFEQMKSGFKITGSAQLTAPSHIVNKSVDYEFSYLGKERKLKPDRYVYPGRYFKANTKSAAVSQSRLSHLSNRVSMNAPHKITVKEEQYVIANVSDMKLHSSELTAASYTEALQQYNQLIVRQPELKDKVQVLSEYELNTI
jgi:hypothetical protein